MPANAGKDGQLQLQLQLQPNSTCKRVCIRGGKKLKGNAFAFRPTPFSEKKFFFFRYKVLERR